MASLKRGIILAAALVAVSILFICMVVSAIAQANEGTGEDKPLPSQLDIVSYEAPTWAKDRVTDCWYMEDRKSQSACWMLRIDDEWVIVPVQKRQSMG